VTLILLLGFVDDVLDLPWRVKLVLPAVAVLPVLEIYYTTFDGTSVIVPEPFRPFLGHLIQLGKTDVTIMGS